jgi:hypothetical protein
VIVWDTEGHGTTYGQETATANGADLEFGGAAAGAVTRLTGFR